MDDQNRCMRCMGQKDSQQETCPACGFSEKDFVPEKHHLQPHTILKGQYLVGCALGEGGFGITYIGWDMFLHIPVAIKEYFPSGVVIRDQGQHTVSVFAGKDEESFLQGRSSFFREAQKVAKFDNNVGVVSVKNCFLENGTAYIIMEYISGINLGAYAELHGGKLTFTETLKLLRTPILTLEELHRASTWHRDISPENLMLTKDGKVKLIDFGSAMESDREKKTRVLMIRAGYSPVEMYSSTGEDGPYSDVYSMAATIYKLITGVTPPPATDRLDNDPLVPPSALGVKDISHAQEAALLKGMAVQVKSRYQTMEEFFDGLYGKNAPAPAPSQHQKRLLIGIAALLVLIMVGVGVLLGRDSQSVPGPAPTEIPTEAPTAAPVPSAVETALRDFLNANGCAIAADEAIPADALARIGGVRLLEGNIDFTFLTDEGELEYRDSFYMNPWRRDDSQTPDVRGEALTTEINLADFACFPNLQYLGVWDKRVTNLDALSKLPCLTTLVLDHCGLTESDLLTIAQHAPLLTTLNISNSGITSVAALASLTKLERLMISNTGVTTLTPLANLTIRQLLTENTAISSINELRGTRLVKCIRQWNCPIVTDGYDVLGEMPQLEEVNIAGDESTKELVLDLSPLANAQNLVWLDVGYVGVQDINFVSSLPNLQYLLIATSNLTSMMIGDATLPESLVYLDFGGNCITSLEELHLERLQKLEYISLHANFITDFSPMEQCTATETWITDQRDPANLMGWLGESLRNALNLPPKAVVTQKMLDNVIGVTVRDGEIEWVFYEEQKNHDAWQRREREVNNWGKYIDKYSDNWSDPLFLTPNPTDADLPTMNPDSFDLSELQYFRHLHYFQLRNQQAEGTWVLPKLPIHWLILSNCGLTDADMPYITAINVDDGERYNELYSLNLGNNAITSLSGMERLATLNVLLVQRNSISDLSPLSDLTRIHLLNISWNPGITSIEPLAQGMRETLVNLDMAGLAVDLTPVGGMENLDHVRLGDDWNSHRISLDLAPLSGLTHLKYLHIFGAKLDNVEAISSMSGLICIDLQNCGLTSAKLTALNGHPLTTEINLERNFLRTLDGLDLSTLPQLKEINLGGNAISDFSMFDGTAITVYGQDWQNAAY
ncbi:MAG: protein kinase domain-containing protein [Christensenellales bacterium]